MRAKYAEAIRWGIVAARKTRYGDVDDPYYEVRRELRWSFDPMTEERLERLASQAFDREWLAVSERRVVGLTDAERREAARTFEVRYDRWMETREERQYRLLREEVAELKRKIQGMENDDD
jgi:hypothetical protein